jgi:hypothetical protein
MLILTTRFNKVLLLFPSADDRQSLRQIDRWYMLTRIEGGVLCKQQGNIAATEVEESVKTGNVIGQIGIDNDFGDWQGDGFRYKHEQTADLVVLTVNATAGRLRRRVSFGTAHRDGETVGLRKLRFGSWSNLTSSRLFMAFSTSRLEVPRFNLKGTFGRQVYYSILPGEFWQNSQWVGA